MHFCYNAVSRENRVEHATSMTLSIDKQNMKSLLKEALLELLEEWQDLFLELISEVIEEAGMVQAIKEGENTEYVTRDDVYAVLRETSWRLPFEPALPATYANSESSNCEIVL